MRDGLGCDVSIVTPHKPSGVLLISLVTGALYELKTVTPSIVKIAEQFESHNCTIERRLELLKIGYE